MTGTLEQTGIPGRLSIWADPLHDGPVPEGLGDEELLEVRARFLGGGAPPDPVNDLRQWRAVIDDHESYGELVLWYEHDLFCQLNLIQVLAYVHAAVPRAKPVSLICIDRFPGRASFKGLGELEAPELVSLFGGRQRVTDRQYGLAEAAWRAFRAPTPEAIERLLRTDAGALPFLAAALGRFLQEYPWTGDGLSRSERRLLELAAAGPMTFAQLFPRMHDGERAHYVTDTSLQALIDRLSQTSPPLLANDSGVVLTDAGRDVLAGRRDRAAMGIDRWMGGVHLHAGAPLWRWDPAARRMTLPGP